MVMTLNSIFLAFLLISRCISACPSHKHLSLNLPETKKSSASKSALPLVFPVSANDSDLHPIPQAKIWGTIFSSSSLILPKDLVTKSVGSPNIFQTCFHNSALCAALLPCFPLVSLEDSSQLLSLSSNTGSL